MTKQEQLDLIKTTLVMHFDIPENEFNWEASLKTLNSDFMFLAYLADLERLLSGAFKIKVPLLENISASFHTPNDIAKLVHPLMK